VVFRVLWLRLVVYAAHGMAANSAVCSASCCIGFVAFPTSISLIICHRVRLGIHPPSAFQLGGLASCVNWLAVVEIWCNAERLINVSQNRN